jgi:phytoene/squalene synthetase
MDVANVAYERWDTLLRYCYRREHRPDDVSRHGRAWIRSADPCGHLGIAMQLTNIARDAEDWERGPHSADELLAGGGFPLCVTRWVGRFPRPPLRP